MTSSPSTTPPPPPTSLPLTSRPPLPNNVGKQTPTTTGGASGGESAHESAPVGSVQLGRRRSIIKEPGSASGSKKSVSFGGLPTELSVKNSSDCVQIMRDGHHLNKMRSSSRIYKRFYWFDELSNCIRWQPSKKDSSKAMIELSTIREVRSGKNTELFLTSDISSMFLDDCSFSIIHGSEGEEESLDLIASSPDEANVWITGIRYLLTPGMCLTRLEGGAEPCCDPRDVWLASMFDRADSNKDGLLDASESLRLITDISDGIRELRVKQKLSEYLQLKDAGDKSRLSRNEFIELFKDVTTRPEIYFLLARYSSISSDQLSPTDLQLFLESEQGLSNVTQEQCLEIIAKYEPCQSARDVPALGIDGFTKYLMSEEGALIDPKHHKVCQDMSQPLHNYFIAASHNTYLMEDQVDGPCSANAYVRALLRCCRCVELDCWDGVKDEPVVTHGHTQTNTILFKKVIEAINASAFRNSQYPVVIYIENHCSQEQQVKMATYMRSIFGSKIYEESSDGKSELPSPDELKCKLIITAKKLPPETEGDAGYVADDDEGAAVKQVISMNAASAAAASNNLVRMSPGSPLDNHPSPTKEMSGGTMWEPLFSTRRRHLLAREMSDLVSSVDRHLHDDQSLDELATATNGQNHLYSMHEQAVFNLIDRSPKQLCDFTKSHLTRVFPKEGRIDSTNFNAQDIWNCGAQIASLNYQTPGLIMDINDGRFSMNGGCGYVLKPKFMRDKLSYFSPFGEQPASLSRCLHLRIISGQNFPKPRGGGAKGHVIDPYVLVELFGVSVDCREDRTRTASNDNGVCPQFDESFEFRLAVPSLVLVRFVVLDDDFIGDEFIGQYTAPLECMRPGYRHLNLRSIYDEPLDHATLFVHIAYTDIDCPLLGAHLSTPMMSAGNSSPNAYSSVGRNSSFRRNGTATSSTVQRWSSRKKNNRNSQNGSLAREPDPICLRPVGLAAFDDAFGRLASSLGKVAAIRDVVRMSLAFFRESCGLAAPTSIKRCIRSLYERSRPRRRTSSCSGDGAAAAQQSSSRDVAAPPLTIWWDRSRRPHLQLVLRANCGVGENWKKTQVAFDNLLNELTMAVEMAEPLDGVFAITLAKIAKLHEDFGQIYDSEYNRSPGHHSAATSSGGGNHATHSPATATTGATSSGGGSETAGKNSSSGGGSERKKSGGGKKRRTVKDLMLDGERRISMEEKIKWNYSMIDATRQLCAHLHDTSTKILQDLWQGAVMCGIGKECDTATTATLSSAQTPHHTTTTTSNGSAEGSTSSS